MSLVERDGRYADCAGGRYSSTFGLILLRVIDDKTFLMILSRLMGLRFFTGPSVFFGLGIGNRIEFPRFSSS